jgi:hypothetical protein
MLVGAQMFEWTHIGNVKVKLRAILGRFASQYGQFLVINESAIEWRSMFIPREMRTSDVYNRVLQL